MENYRILSREHKNEINKLIYDDIWNTSIYFFCPLSIWIKKKNTLFPYGKKPYFYFYKEFFNIIHNTLNE